MKGLVGWAVRNNAELVAAVQGAHGNQPEWGERIWTTGGPAVPLYPNLVTLAPGAQDDVVRFIEDNRIRGPWGLKDSWADLDLGAWGFSVLLEGRWLGVPAGMGDRSADQLHPVTTADELVRWEEAWAGSPGDNRTFPAALLGSDLSFWALVDDGEVTGGCITNQTDGVVGFSNVFGLDRGESGWKRTVRALGAKFAGNPLVCWEPGSDQRDPENLGFRSLGPLRVWVGPEVRPGRPSVHP